MNGMRDVVVGLGLGLALLVAGQAWGAKRYEMSGRVTGIKGDTVSVSRGLETLEFKRGKALRGLKVGDEVMLQYELDVRDVKRASSGARQMPGRAAPGVSAPVKLRSPSSDEVTPPWRLMPGAPSEDGVPGEKKQILLDDRAFYDARVSTPRGSNALAGLVRLS